MTATAQINNYNTTIFSSLLWLLLLFWSSNLIVLFAVALCKINPLYDDLMALYRLRSHLNYYDRRGAEEQRSRGEKLTIPMQTDLILYQIRLHWND